jgi:hypothetical protein
MKDIINFKYCEIYQLSKLQAPSDGRDLVFRIDEDVEIKIIITSNIESYSSWVDRRNAIFGKFVSSGIPTKEINFETWEKKILPVEIEKQVNRKKERITKNGAFVIFESQGSVEIDLKGRKTVQFGPYIWDFELIDNIPSGDLLRDEKNRFFTAINITNSILNESKLITRGSVFFRDDGTELFSYEISADSEWLTISKPLDDKRTEEVNKLWQSMRKEKDLDRVYGLLSSSSDLSRETFRRYTDAWNGLEILTNKLNDYYKKEIIERLIKNNTRKTEKVLLDKVEILLNKDSKFSLLERFSFIADILFDKPENKIYKFSSFKKVRDDFFHGRRLGITDDELPIVEMADLTLELLHQHLWKQAFKQSDE